MFKRGFLVTDVFVSSGVSVSNYFESSADAEKRILSSKRKLFCRCGHVSKGVLDEVRRRPMHTFQQAVPIGDSIGYDIEDQSEEMDLSKGPYVLYPFFRCPECGERPDHYLKWGPQYPTSFLEQTTLFDNRIRRTPGRKDTIALSFGWTEYYFNRKVEKLGQKHFNLRLVYNLNTKNLYVVKPTGRRMVMNASFGRAPQSLMTAIRLLDDAGRQKFIHFMDLIVHDALPYFTLNDFQETTSSLWHQLAFIMTHIRIPQLQLLPFRNVMSMMEPARKQLRNKPMKAKTLWQDALGVQSKRIRKLIKTPATLHAYHGWSAYVKDPNNLCKLFENPLPDRRDYIELENLMASRISEPTYGATSFDKAWRFFINLHKGDETTLVNRILKIMKREYEGYGPERRLVSESFSLTHAESIMADCVNQLESIYIRDIDYEFKFDGDITRFHDRLSRDLSRYENPYAEIPYSHEEREAYEREVDGYTFQLADSNHTLVDVGNDMNICVGSYGQRACQKRCVIVLVLKEGHIVNCIELSRGRYYGEEGGIDSPIRMIQAKCHHNSSPDEDLSTTIAKWAYESNTYWDTCGDLDRARGGEYPEIPGGQQPVWADAPTEELSTHRHDYGQYLKDRYHAMLKIGLYSDDELEHIHDRIRLRQRDLQVDQVAPQPVGIDVGVDDEDFF